MAGPIDLDRQRRIRAIVNDAVQTVSPETMDRALDHERREDRMAARDQIAFRFEQELITRLDHHGQVMGSRMRGIKVSRADAVRTLLYDALDRAELDYTDAEKALLTDSDS